METHTFNLTDDEAKYLRKEIVGNGGFQCILRELQKKLTNENKIKLNHKEIKKVAKYAESFGPGGFQGRLSHLLFEIDDAFIRDTIDDKDTDEE